MAKQDKKIESYQVEQRINKVFVDPGTAGLVSSVAGPDAADRNLAYIAEVSGSVEPRDIAPTWIGDGSSMATGLATDEGQLTNNLQSTDSATDDVAGGGSIHQE